MDPVMAWGLTMSYSFHSKSEFFQSYFFAKRYPLGFREFGVDSIERATFDVNMFFYCPFVFV